jgi:hypothetical protein
MRVFLLVVALALAVSAATRCAPQPAGPGGMPGDWGAPQRGMGGRLAGRPMDPDRPVAEQLKCDDPSCGCRRFMGPHCVDREECDCEPWDGRHAGRVRVSGE